MTLIYTPPTIRFAQLLARRAALRMEVNTPLRRKGRPILTVIREAYPSPAITATRTRAAMLPLINALVDLGIAEFNKQYPQDGVYVPPPPQ